MHIHEVPAGRYNPHPWEISRAHESMAILNKQFYPLRKHGQGLCIADIGAGDMYFAKEYLKNNPQDIVYAIDINYTDLTSGHERIRMAKRLEDVPDVVFDAVVMMDMFEYIPDEVRFLEQVRDAMRPGGVLYFTLPAFQFLYSPHDEYVKNLRRYSIRRFRKTINMVDGIRIETVFYFYSMLFFVRATKKLLRMATHTDQQKVPFWKYPEDHAVTKGITALLNADFRLWHGLQRIGLKLPGLSLCAVCKLKDDTADNRS